MKSVNLILTLASWPLLFSYPSSLRKGHGSAALAYLFYVFLSPFFPSIILYPTPSGAQRALG